MGGLSSPLSFPLLLSLVLVFGVVRAQPCEHARYPRTPLCPLVTLSRVSLSLSFLSPPFFSLRLSIVWNGGVCLPCVGVLGGHDGDG